MRLACIMRQYVWFAAKKNGANLAILHQWLKERHARHAGG
jgi:hypothetical protein